MNMKDWAQIAKTIKENYDAYDGFVVIHGTDTMAYSASGLSFMLENLGIFVTNFGIICSLKFSCRSAQDFSFT